VSWNSDALLEGPLHPENLVESLDFCGFWVPTVYSLLKLPATQPPSTGPVPKKGKTRTLALPDKAPPTATKASKASSSTSKVKPLSKSKKGQEESFGVGPPLVIEEIEAGPAGPDIAPIPKPKRSHKKKLPSADLPLEVEIIESPPSSSGVVLPSKPKRSHKRKPRGGSSRYQS
jgi:hypothetical protein